MIVTKKYLPRRTVLRGLGATVALPFLDAMVPALTAAAQTAANPVPRMGFFYVPNGMFLPSFHPKGDGGTNFALTPTLMPLEPFRDQMVVVSGLSNSGVVSTNEGGGVHTRAHGGWLSGVLPKRTEDADLRAGKTLDQYAADKLGADTSLRSLELTIDSNYQVGNCENGYSCAYLNSSSWLTETTPLPHERDPRVVFQRLFGDGGSVESRLVQMQTDSSILDSVTESIGRLERRWVCATARQSTSIWTPYAKLSGVSNGGTEQQDDAAPSAGPASGCTGRLRRACHLVARPAGVGVPVGCDSRELHADVSRAQRTQLSRYRCARGASHRLAPPAGWPQHRAVHEDQHLPHVFVREASGQDAKHARRRRNAAGLQHPHSGAPGWATATSTRRTTCRLPLSAAGAAR